jgi:SprT protein
MTEIEIIHQCESKIAEAFEKAEKYYNKKFDRPRVVFTLKGMAAGRAYYSENKISLNLKIAKDNFDEFIKDTPQHEAAHLIVNKIYSSATAHGREWKHVMENVLNIPAKRCHNYAVKTPYKYKCGCRELYLTKRMHNNISQRGKHYKCNFCSQRLAFSFL